MKVNAVAHWLMQMVNVIQPDTDTVEGCKWEGRQKYYSSTLTGKLDAFFIFSSKDRVKRSGYTLVGKF